MSHSMILIEITVTKIKIRTQLLAKSDYTTLQNNTVSFKSSVLLEASIGKDKTIRSQNIKFSRLCVITMTYFYSYIYIYTQYII